MLTAAKTWFPILDEELASPEMVRGVMDGRFRFCGEEHRLDSPFDWTVNPSRDIEWLILLHKFYYAPGLGLAWQETRDARYAARWMELTRSWMESTPLDFLPSDVAGRRIQNWISAWYFFADCPHVTDRFRRDFLASVQRQAEWLGANLTPARNHRTLELLALFYAGIALPELPQADGWVEFARVELIRNLETDFRPDGVHCEQSTAYHHIVLRNALIAKRLAVRNGITMPAAFDAALRRALEFALWIHRPDGWIPALSDGDTGCYLPLLEQGYEFYGDERFLWAATRGTRGSAPRQRTAAFPDGGYYIWRSGWGEDEPYADERYLVFDCGPLGDGNHGHLDLLSFELYGFGQPLIVDPGRYTYCEDGPVNWRVLFRGTEYHNTVTVDGRNQTRYEFRHRKFKIREPHASFEMVHRGPDAWRGRVVSAEYDAVHEREIRMLDDRRFLIVDQMTAETEHAYDLRLHLSPRAWGRVSVEAGAVCAPHLRITQASPGVRLSFEEGWVSPTYGEKEPAPVVRYSATGKTQRFETHLEVIP